VRDHYGQLLGIGSQWRVTKVEIDHAGRELRAWVEWKARVKQECPQCGRPCPGYDRLAERTWRHLDACGYKTLLHARIPRCECPEHGVLSQRPSWAEPGSRFTLAFEAHAVEVLQGARSVSAARKLLRVGWQSVFSIQQRAVKRGLALRDLQQIVHLGIDEKSFGKGHQYGTVVSDLEGKRVLEVSRHREENSVREALEALPKQMLQKVKAVAMDMWRPFMNVTQQILPWAAIVHDKFHIMGYLNKAVDLTRRSEHHQLQKQGDQSLKGSKYLWLKNPCHLSPSQEEEFARLLALNLKAGRAWASKEMFYEFWNSPTRTAAQAMFHRWFTRAKRSKIKPLKEAADTLKRHLPNILTYFENRITNAAAEGLNSLIQAIKTNARGFRSFANYRTAILFHLGKLNLMPNFGTHSKL